ncbi:tryptophan synthase, alpha chain [Alteribacillus persepolensis]|uniref:Tryptophan synthase alpha chain n=1 Tax=Alteribacillus persepolensis TaxID=568899 RepID=A0A1G7ZFB6_9BACI|nr:tryptophan synthase subunit alpha [Alteribacillus persepolensis]SDH07398.1 tryptophan synthase, alpha chain [Alteribacillus persepolensis]
MNRLTVYEAAHNADYPLFIPFIMAGDPTRSATVDLALQLQEAGAHILELGIPYSDPLADGPVLQRSAKRALQQGMSLKSAMDLIPEMRKRGLTIPVVVFTYYNPVFQMGMESFLETANEKGADGVLVPDLPFEESQDFTALAKDYQLANISLVAPTSTTRVHKIASHAEGFLYCVSSLGVTGTREVFPQEAYDFIHTVKEHSAVPVAVGFGISKPEHVQSLSGICSGVIVGSAIMKLVEKHANELAAGEEKKKEALQEIKTFVSTLISS